MGFTEIEYVKEEGLAWIKLNRPRVLNAMNRAMWLQMMEALDKAMDDPQVKVLVFTGNGRAFSTGADLKESKTRSLADYRAYLESLQEASRRILNFPKPTLAAVNGYALGSGYELALACDIRIAAETAQIGSPEARVNSSVTGGALRLVQDLVGPAKARELLFTAQNIDGAEACRIGLVNRVVPEDELLNEARAMARAISANSSFSLKMIKKGLLMAAGEASLSAIMDFEVEACLACVSTKEREESLEQFAHRKEK